MASQLAEFKLDVIDGGVDLGAPFFEHLGCGLELDDAVTMEALRFQETMLPLEVALRKTLVEFVGEALVDFVEEDFGVGIHRSCAFLQTREVVVGRKGIQDRGSDTRMLAAE
nr:uncharacterized protein LOC117866413 [Setaria viridis]